MARIHSPYKPPHGLQTLTQVSAEPPLPPPPRRRQRPTIASKVHTYNILITEFGNWNISQIIDPTYHLHFRRAYLAIHEVFHLRLLANPGTIYLQTYDYYYAVHIDITWQTSDTWKTRHIALSCNAQYLSNCTQLGIFLGQVCDEAMPLSEYISF